MKKSEKTLVGVAMIAGGIALIVAMGLPQWDAYTANNGQITSLNEEIKNLGLQKDNLNAQIALLQKNTDIPPGIQIRTFTEKNREQIIKSLLDQVVVLATSAGNKFISLAPSATPATPVVPEPPRKVDPPASNAPATGTGTTADSASAAGKAAEPALPAPILSTFAYDIAFRGTYDTIQAFLRSMDGQKELLEVSGITLENEALSNASGAGSSDQLSDPNYPIRLTAHIRLALQPQN